MPSGSDKRVKFHISLHTRLCYRYSLMVNHFIGLLAFVSFTKKKWKNPKKSVSLALNYEHSKL